MKKLLTILMLILTVGLSAQHDTVWVDQNGTEFTTEPTGGFTVDSMSTEMTDTISGVSNTVVEGGGTWKIKFNPTKFLTYFGTTHKETIPHSGKNSYFFAFDLIHNTNGDHISPFFIDYNGNLDTGDMDLGTFYSDTISFNLGESITFGIPTAQHDPLYNVHFTIYRLRTSVYINTSNVSNIEDHRLEFTVYPNPVVDQLNFSESNFDFTILDMSGKPVKSGHLSDNIMDVSMLDRGNYILVARTDDWSIMKEFVKE